MADTPKRPIKFTFVLGKGLVKRRRESINPTQAVVEQATISFAQNTWDASRQMLSDRIAADVRAELVHVAGQFRRYVIGAPGNQRGVVGTLTTVAKGDQPKQSLGSLPRWAPRGAKYLARKDYWAGHINWFDNTDWNVQGKWPDHPGLLKEFFASETEGSVNIGSGGILEKIFGGITVQVIRNNRGWGVNQGSIQMNSKGTKAQVQLGTIRVRALGKVTNNMLRFSDSPNTELLNTIGSYSAEASRVALHLRGGRGRYRPTLEPYLKFFLEQAMPHAVNERIRKGIATGTLLRR